MHMRRWLLAVLLGWVMALTVACGDRELPDLGLFSTPTPQPLPTPQGDLFTIAVPVYPIELAAGQSVPGTRLTYVGASADTLQVMIGGLSAEKRINDSFEWEGVIAPGVVGDYDLRLQQPPGPDRLFANGPVSLTILRPVPIESDPILTTETPIVFRDVPINEIVPPTRRLPGTSLIFEGEQQGRVVFIGGNTVPSYAIGDTLIWRGKLRDNVYVTYDLKVVGMETFGVRVEGSAEFSIYPSANPALTAPRP